MATIPPSTGTTTTGSTDQGGQFTVTISLTGHFITVIGTHRCLTCIGSTTTSSFYFPHSIGISTTTIDRGINKISGLTPGASLTVLFNRITTRAGTEYTLTTGCITTGYKIIPIARITGFHSGTGTTGCIDIHEDFNISIIYRI